MLYRFMQMVAKGWNNIRYSTILYIRFDLYFYLPCMEYNGISVMVSIISMLQLETRHMLKAIQRTP